MSSQNISIVTINTNSVTLKPEHRPATSDTSTKGKGAAQAAMGAIKEKSESALKKAALKKAAKQATRKAKGQSGGAANAFLFILKVSCTGASESSSGLTSIQMIGVLAFIAFAWAALVSILNSNYGNQS